MNKLIDTLLKKQLDNFKDFEKDISSNLEKISDMVENFNTEEVVSKYWQEEIEGFLYLFQNYPLVYNKLRDHCYHITGIKSYEYREHHSHLIPNFKKKYQKLKQLDSSNLFVEESKAMGGFGFSIENKLMNIDTLKFYEFMIGLNFSGFLEEFKKNNKNTIVEIGSGWGGFAYNFKTIFPNSTYVLVDLPFTFVFSLNYLKNLFPSKKFLIWDENLSKEKIDITEYDFVFCPSHKIEFLNKQNINHVINMVSFQEMKTENVEYYSNWIKGNNIENLYSLNRDRSKHNTELTTVTEILQKNFDISHIHLIDEQYTNIKKINDKKPRPVINPSIIAKSGNDANLNPKIIHLLNKIWKFIFNRKLVVKKKSKMNVLDYRHLFCKLKKK